MKLRAVGGNRVGMPVLACAGQVWAVYTHASVGQAVGAFRGGFVNQRLAFWWIACKACCTARCVGLPGWEVWVAEDMAAGC